jgi:hypothetical protein
MCSLSTQLVMIAHSHVIVHKHVHWHVVPAVRRYNCG